MKVKKIVVDSGIIADHLITEKGESVLRQLSREYFCYTTVFNAIELFAAAGSLTETAAIQDSMNALKILGINPKSSKSVAAVVRSSKRKAYATLIASVCIESKLAIVTAQPKRFAGIKGLTVLNSKELIGRGKGK